MTHSYVFHLTKSPRYFAAVDEVREPHSARTIGVDLSADYLRLARWRCTEDVALRRKVTGSEPVKVHPDQLDLFGDVA